MSRSPPEKMPLVIPILDRFQAGFLSLSSFTREFWKPGGMLYRRERASDQYLVTCHPNRPVTVARLTPSSNRSTRVDLFMTKTNRQVFKRACTDHQLAAWSWSASSNDLILSMSSNEAFEVGAVVASLFNRKKIM